MFTGKLMLSVCFGMILNQHGNTGTIAKEDCSSLPFAVMAI